MQAADQHCHAVPCRIAFGEQGGAGTRNSEVIEATATRPHGITAAGLFYCRTANGTRLAVCLFSRLSAKPNDNYLNNRWHEEC
jgi:hypothetical protein